MVLRMEPDKGYLQAGDSLKVYISLGPEYIDVPNLYEYDKTAGNRQN